MNNHTLRSVAAFGFVAAFLVAGSVFSRAFAASDEGLLAFTERIDAQMEQLDERNFAALTTIHKMRASVELGRYREEQEIARIQRDAAATASSISEGNVLGARIAELRGEKIASLGSELKNRYSARLAALASYEQLVNSRIKGQQEHLSGYEDLMKQLADPSLPDSAKVKFTERLRQMREQSAVRERVFRCNKLFIEERLAFEEMRGRKLATLNDARMQVEDAWRSRDSNIRSRLVSLEKERNAPGITKERKRAVSDEMDRLFGRQDVERLYHENALTVIADREELLLRELDGMRMYLDSRNAIRLEMAERATTPELLREYREEMAGLERDHMNVERGIRERLGALERQMPAAYRVTQLPDTRLVSQDIERAVEYVSQ